MSSLTKDSSVKPSTLRHASTSGSVEDGVIEVSGYDQSYRRVLKGIGTFAIVLAVASPMGGLLIISSYQILYGGYWGLTWGWFIPAILFLPQPLAVAELCSSMPVNGANYWWAAVLAPPSISRPLSYISGWTMVLQFMCGVASFAFASGTSLTYLISSLRPDYVPTNAQVMGISMAVLAFWSLISLFRMERMSMVYILSCGLVVVTTGIFLIGLPVSHSVQGRPFAKSSDVFGKYTNYSDWNDAVAVPITFFSAAWVITGWNSPTYVAEQTKNARIVCPRSILETYTAISIMGFACCIVSASCLADMDAAAMDPTGLPLYTLIFDHWGTKLAVAFLLTSTGNSIIGGSSYLLTTASQIAAFARDGGLPFVNKLSYINQRTNMAIWPELLLVIGGMTILLFGLSTTAGSIIFSLAVIANLITMALPIGLRLFAGERFVPGPWNYGRYSKPIHAWALLSICYILIMECFPLTSHWTAESFNYSWVVALGVVLAACVAWFALGHRYKGLDLRAI